MTDFKCVSEGQHSILQSLLLHLLPGGLILVFFLITAPVLERSGALSFLSLLLAIAFVLVPFELGNLLVQGKKFIGTLSLKGIVLYQEPIPGWQYAALAIPLLAWSGLMMMVSPLIDNDLIDELFSWLPARFFIVDFAKNLGQYSQSVLILTAVLGVILNGLLGPIVEDSTFMDTCCPGFRDWGTGRRSSTSCFSHSTISLLPGRIQAGSSHFRRCSTAFGGKRISFWAWSCIAQGRWPAW